MLAFNGEASHLYKDEMRKGTNFLGSLKLNTGKVLNNILFHSILDVVSIHLLLCLQNEFQTQASGKIRA